MSLRIIGGQWRSRRLVRPETASTRPMPDRVKQSIFNILGSYFETPGALPLFRVADVFAGSGSMGLEALSRGAAHCRFYESDRIALAALRKNIVELDAEKASTVVTGDAWRSAARDAGLGAFQLIFLDPPYCDSEDPSTAGQVMLFLREIAEKMATSKSQQHNSFPLIVLHHFAQVNYAPENLPAPWAIVDQRRFGTSAVTFFAASS